MMPTHYVSTAHFTICLAVFRSPSPKYALS